MNWRTSPQRGACANDDQRCGSLITPSHRRSSLWARKFRTAIWSRTAPTHGKNGVLIYIHCRFWTISISWRRGPTIPIDSSIRMAPTPQPDDPKTNRRASRATYVFRQSPLSRVSRAPRPFVGASLEGQEWGRFDPFAKRSANGRYLRGAVATDGVTDVFVGENVPLDRPRRRLTALTSRARLGRSTCAMLKPARLS